MNTHLKDPIFMLIAERDKLEDAHVAACKATDDAMERGADTADTEAAQDQACKLVCDFEREVLFPMKPSSREGAFALLGEAVKRLTPFSSGQEALQAADNAMRFLKMEMIGATAVAEAEEVEEVKPSACDLAIYQRDRSVGLACLFDRATDGTGWLTSDEMRGIAQLVTDNAKAASEVYEAIRAEGVADFTGDKEGRQ